MFLQRVDQAVVLADPRSGDYYGLDDTAGRIWMLLDGIRTVEDLCLEMQAAYDVDPSECETEVIDFLDDMLNKSLIRLVPISSAQERAAAE